METMSKKQTAKSGKGNKVGEQKMKSKFTLFWEKYPEGGTIYDMRAVLK